MSWMIRMYGPICRPTDLLELPQPTRTDPSGNYG